MKVTLQKISMRNFKGARKRDEVFPNPITIIPGANGTGKTTIMDAFLWLLFDKDSTGRKDFEVKTLDGNNQPIHRLDHEVSAILMVDGIRNELRKTYKEKWVRPRGSEMEELQGHETTYYWNDVPMKKSEYEARIASLIPEQLFRMVTNPLYFNNTLKWEERRTMLMQMAGTISSANILATITTGENKHRMDALLDVLATGKRIDEYRKELANKRRKVKEELDTMPARIDEAKRSKPEPIDTTALQTELSAIEKQIADIDAILQTGTAAQQEYRKRINDASAAVDSATLKVNKLKRDAEQAFYQAQAAEGSEASAIQAKITRAESERELVEADLKSTLQNMERLRNSLEIVRQNWQTVNAEKFDRETCQVNSSCPTCKQSLPEHDVEGQIARMADQWAANKQRSLEAITQTGKNQRSQLDSLEKLHSDLMERSGIILDNIIKMKDELATVNSKPKSTTTLQEALDANTDLQQAMAELATAWDKQREAEQSKPEANDNELQSQKATLKAQATDLIGRIATAGEAERIDKRIAELENQLRSMAQEMADLEAAEYACTQYEKAYMSTVESRVNAMFSMVQFKLFEQQLNGGETPTCIALINGVPFQDANRASQINAGLDIINTLCRHHSVNAPIFVDNAEAVNRFIPVDSQLILLQVTAPEASLKNASVALPEQMELFS